jgi:hypothetical protein
MSSPTVSVEVEELDPESVEYSFLGSLWDFVRLADGRAFWIHASGKTVPASGNREE